MPPPLLFPLDSIDLTRVVMSKEEIYTHLPQRHEFELLDGVLHLDVPGQKMVAYHDTRDDEWWVKAHIPGRPLIPGVLMIEMAAHMSGVYFNLALENNKFLAFGGVEKVKFREAVTPGSRLIFLGRALEIRPRRMVSEFQGIVDDRLVIEGRITGLPIDF